MKEVLVQVLLNLTNLDIMIHIMVTEGIHRIQEPIHHIREAMTDMIDMKMREIVKEDLKEKRLVMKVYIFHKQIIYFNLEISPNTESETTTSETESDRRRGKST